MIAKQSLRTGTFADGAVRLNRKITSPSKIVTLDKYFTVIYKEIVKVGDIVQDQKGEGQCY